MNNLFDDLDLGGERKKAPIKVPPPVPHTGWLPPTEFPDLSDAAAIAIDTETKEPEDFDSAGPGWSRGKGHIVGFSVAAKSRCGFQKSWYYPLRHEVHAHLNLNPVACLNWLRQHLENPAIPKVGANLIYDLGWLTAENIWVQGELHDVQFAEALLHEEQLVNLEHLGRKYVGTGKDSDAMYRWLAETYGGSVNGKQRANIYRCPPELVGFYAESDADLPLQIIEKQWPLLASQQLTDVYRMECDLIYLLIRMRLTGVRVDIDAAQRLNCEITADIQRLNRELEIVTGVRANVNSSKDLAKVFDTIGLQYPATAKGNPSFKGDFLNTVDHPVAQLIRDIREHEKVQSTFIQAYILDKNVNGRLHCQFHPLRAERGGTRSGRFASSNPNLQNIPVRSELGRRVRTLFVPDIGHVAWEKNDYSQIEYRFLAHFAVGPRSDDVRAEYNSDPKTDYHVLTQKLVKEIANLEIKRKPIKNINFGLLYGMGKAKLMKQLGVGKFEGEQIFTAYHDGNPYVKATMDDIAGFAQHNGYIQTILNRRSRFNQWEPRDIDYRNRAMPLGYEQALGQWGCDIIRAKTHKAINRKLQGSAADIIKEGMHQCWKDGVYDVIGVPKLQVHDETDHSVIDNSPEQVEAYKYMRHVLETCIQLSVPVVVDHEQGASWGAVD